MHTPNILIVSDALNLRASIVGILEHAGFKVDTAQMATALHVLESKQFDFLFLDLRAPHRDGLKLLSSVRFMYSSVHTIVISSIDGSEFREKVIRNGARDYLLKPVDPVEIIQSVQRLSL